MKALEKDRQRRYTSALSLAEDIERHLHSEPVLAAAPSLLYRSGKFVRRNPGPLALAALGIAVLALVAFEVGSRLKLSAATGSFGGGNQAALHPNGTWWPSRSRPIP